MHSCRQLLLHFNFHFGILRTISPLCSFFNKINVLAAADYVPTEEDVLRSRVRTSGIIEESYDIGGVEFLIYDVGGQVRAVRTARRAI